MSVKRSPLDISFNSHGELSTMAGTLDFQVSHHATYKSTTCASSETWTTVVEPKTLYAPRWGGLVADDDLAESRAKSFARPSGLSQPPSF